MICYNMQESMVSTKLECEQVKDVLTANIQGEKNFALSTLVVLVWNWIQSFTM